MPVRLCATLARNLAAERRGSTTLSLDFSVRLFVHLDWLLVVVISLIALDLLAHNCNVLVNLGRDTVDAGLGKRHACAVCRQVSGAARRTLEPAAGDLF
jgi:hypothetical protein